MKKMGTSFVAVVLSAAMLMTPVSAASAFSDVPDTHWGYEYIQRSAENDLVAGVGDGLFQPDNSVSNSEWVTMVCNLLFKTKVNAYLFGISSSLGTTDTIATNWWYAYMEVARNQKLLTNTSVLAIYNANNGSWKQVGDGISRYDMAQIIYNVSQNLSWQAISSDALAQAKERIADWAGIPEGYQDAVAYCYAAGFIGGMDEDGTFGGEGIMTRAQATVVLCRMLDVKNGTHTFGA